MGMKASWQRDSTSGTRVPTIDLSRARLVQTGLFPALGRVSSEVEVARRVSSSTDPEGSSPRSLESNPHLQQPNSPYSSYNPSNKHNNMAAAENKVRPLVCPVLIEQKLI